MPKIIVGLSGGVDSCVAVLLLQQQGYEVIGVHLNLWNPAGEHEENAVRRLGEQLHIPIHFVDGRHCFREKVVRPFIQDYLSGKTPNPCSTCNRFIKWHLLRAFADSLRIETIATGHYVNIREYRGHCYVHKGEDTTKDQSYFLWGVPEEILRHAQTPLGNYTKQEVKEIARANGFGHLAAKKESSSICFLEGSDYRHFIQQASREATLFRPGEIIDEAGEIIGQHEGLALYTIGQRKGLPLKNGHPRYVKEMNPITNQLIVGDKVSLETIAFSIHSIHLICPEEIYADDIQVRVRGLGLNPEGFAHVDFLTSSTLTVRLASPAWAMAPGQPVVLYRGERVIGGGIF